jgi:hypothetical protein
MPAAPPMNVRRRALILPREHGAWGILLVPLAAGACVGLWTGGSVGGLTPLTIATLALFWLRTPLESWTGAAAIRAQTPDEFRVVRRFAAALGIAAAGALTWLLWGGQRWALLWLGAAAGIAFLLQFGVKRRLRTARAAAQIIGAAGLTATAPAAYFVTTGRLDAAAWTLWTANFLFAANQIHFVQLRIHTARAANRREKVVAGRWFLAGQAGLTVALVASWWTAGFAFVPVLVRGFAWFAARPGLLAVHALGKSELAHAIVFGVLLVLGMTRA